MLSSLILAGALLLAAGCTPVAQEIALARSDRPRRAAEAPQADREALVAGNAAFAFDLYRSLRSKTGNLFLSPYSVSSALAMVYAGARGETKQQMAEVLHFDLPQERLHPAFNFLDQTLTGSNDDPEAFQLRIANSVWGQTGHSFRSEYLDVLAENYGTGLRLVDFAGASEPARQAINRWVAEQTADRIEDLMPPGSVTADTRLVLANAIYFKARWETEFMPWGEGDFTLADGAVVKTPFMTRRSVTRYLKGDGFEAVEIAYRGRRARMVLIVPAPGQFATIESGLDAAQAQKILDNLEETDVALEMPKFSFESSFSLAETLAAMGMPDAFNETADFSGMDGSGGMFISRVEHKAFVEVNELGTEAAAATTNFGAMSIPSSVSLTVDRPFLFLIQDLPTGTVLFVGRVVDPR
ncbi:MAG: serpin family protein [Anaerolineales bacterium]|nr:serpin family protein [Anaerolineales bacterium]